MVFQDLDLSPFSGGQGKAIYPDGSELVFVSGLAGISFMTVTLYDQNSWKLYKDHSINV